MSPTAHENDNGIDFLDTPTVNIHFEIFISDTEPDSNETEKYTTQLTAKATDDGILNSYSSNALDIPVPEASGHLGVAQLGAITENTRISHAEDFDPGRTSDKTPSEAIADSIEPVLCS